MPSPGSVPRTPLFWLLLPFMAGIAAAGVWPGLPLRTPALAWLAAAVAVVAGGLARSERRGLSLASLGAIAVAAALAGSVSQRLHAPRVVAWTATPREVTATVEVEEVFPDKPGRTTINGLGRITAADVHVAEIIGERLYFSVLRNHGLRPLRSGSYLIRGVVQAHRPAAPEPSGFDRYLESRGIRLTLTRAQALRETRPPGWFARFCARTEARLEGILKLGVARHGEAVAIYLGMLLGERAVLSEEQQLAFMRSGTFHIFVIAGLHVGVIAAAIYGVLQLLRVPRRGAVLAGLGILWLYVQVTGAGLPARRAFLMIAFLQGARVFRRPGNALAALALAALATLLLDPQQLFNAGFQMSYSVVTALVVMGSPLSRRWAAAWNPWRDLPEADWGWFRHGVTWTGQELLGALAISWVALLASAPSMIGNFGLLSPGSLAANLVIIPVACAVISAGFGSLVAGLGFLAPVSVVFNHAAVVLIKLMEVLVTAGARLEGVYVPARFSQPWMAPAALALVIGTMLLGASLRWRRMAGGYWPPVLALVLVMFFGVKFG